jgi:hypothetical protein
MQPAAEVDEPIRAAGQRSEHVGREHVHGQSLRVTFGGCGAGRLEVDAGIVDNSVHPADLVHLAGEVPGLGGTAEVADDHSCGVEVAERRRPLAGAGVEDNVMAFTDEDTDGAVQMLKGSIGTLAVSALVRARSSPPRRLRDLRLRWPVSVRLCTIAGMWSEC